MTRTIDTIQILRFIAALLVVVYHVQPPHVSDGAADSIYNFIKNGGAGVDIFFVISGFIITVSATSSKNFSPSRFVTNRFFRIFPPYWIILFCALVLAVVAQTVTGNSASYDLISPASLLSSFFLVPVGPQIYPVAWTLTLEITFYILFCVFVMVGGLRAVMLALLVWYGVSQVYLYALEPMGVPFQWLFHSVVLEFLYGVIIATIWLRGPIKAAVPMFLLGAVLFSAAVIGVFDPFGLPREFTWGLPAAVLVYGASGITWKAPRIAVLAGDSSYILYLCHPIAIIVMNFAGERALGLRVQESDLIGGVVIVGSVLVSLAATQWLEKPYIKWYKRRTQSAGAGHSREATNP